MNLEDKVAWWIDLGTRPYQEVYELQKQLVTLRMAEQIPDVILSVQHPTEINFGNSNEHNRFSKEFLESVGLTEDSLDINRTKAYLETQNISFSQRSRGGGATVFAPGQLVYYPIVDYEKITGRSLGVGEYKSKIYKIMFGTLSDLGIKGIDYSGKSLTTRDERRDVWLQKGGISYKLGSKGLQFSKNVASHGFALYLDKQGIAPFWMIRPCGYDHKAVSITSVEDELGYTISPKEVHSVVKNRMIQEFGYRAIVEQSSAKLQNMGVYNGAA